MFSMPGFLSFPKPTRHERATSDAASLVQSQPQPVVEKTARTNLEPQSTNTSDPEGQVLQATENDVFGNEDGAEVHYKTCKW